MKAIIVHSLSKDKRSLEIAKQFDGDLFIIEPSKKPLKNYVLQLIYYGFLTVSNKEVGYKPLDIDFKKYDEIVLISPIWAGQVNAYMRTFLKQHDFHDKQVTIIASCNGGYKNYFDSYKGLIDGCNTIVDKQVYIKGVKQ